MGQSPYLDEILGVFDRYVPKGKLDVLEIGGAPGRYLACMARTFGHNVSCLDYSEVGCRKTLENFKMLKIDGNVMKADLFNLKDGQGPDFDLVYSLGLVEHFEDMVGVVRRHLEFLKPEGTLLIGMPNMLGLNGVILRRTAPKILATHHLPNMNVTSWSRFEKELNITPVFKGYVGGFEPGVFAQADTERDKRKVTYKFARRLSKIFRSKNLNFLRGINGRAWSGYVMGVYKRTSSP